MEEQKLEKLMKQGNDARLVNLAEQLIYPLLQVMRDQRTTLMINELTLGKLEHAHHVAYLKALEDVRIHLEHIQKRGEKAFQAISQT